jgi:hypothetical protein
MSNSEKNRGETPSGPTLADPTGPAAPPCSGGRLGFPCTALFCFLSPWEKVGPVNLCEKLQKNKGKTIYKNPCLVFRPRLDVRDLLPW